MAYADGTHHYTITSNKGTPVYAPWFIDSQLLFNLDSTVRVDDHSYWTNQPTSQYHTVTVTNASARTQAYTYYGSNESNPTNNNNIKYIQLDPNNDTFNIKTVYSNYNHQNFTFN